MMMKMTKLEELINELCSDGVEYKTIGEIVEVRFRNLIQILCFMVAKHQCLLFKLLILKMKGLN